MRLLRKIQRHILAEPRRLYMNWFVKTGAPGEVFRSDVGNDQIMPDCGTAACIAGWANILTHGNDPSDYDRAVMQLGMSEYKPEIFDAPRWPEPFHFEYEVSETPEKRAKIAAARIEHLITTGE